MTSLACCSENPMRNITSTNTSSSMPVPAGEQGRTFCRWPCLSLNRLPLAFRRPSPPCGCAQVPALLADAPPQRHPRVAATLAFVPRCLRAKAPPQTFEPQRCDDPEAPRQGVPCRVSEPSEPRRVDRPSPL